ncbi:hypothetical protein [Glaciimonas soli]|uniref:Uncharacterized protein n=1 Tax=Glaciimonas soli TaxID=2590999 RepID=A0A843YSE9_9BURK|nr:hypothetical protein [Glaciimonas soli]MQR02060.1 hypothetical protein [Glaciimonas soli]
MNKFDMDKLKIREAAEKFQQALLHWKSEEKIRSVAAIHRPNWKEEDVENSIRYNTKLINPILDAFKPIYNLAVEGDIDEPFDFTGYMGGRIGRVLWDELSYPEILQPLEILVELLKGGLSSRDFLETNYYKLHLLPKKFKTN